MDVIHGYIKISPTCVKIIDTPEFQRLRNVKQLGFVYFVYPSANHTRFEHCIGVSYLAGKMARQLLKPFSYDKAVKEVWIKCTEVAGLCHDLGHGPFSHDSELFLGKGEKHEQISIRRFNEMWNRHEKIRNCINLEEREIVKAMILPEEHKHIIDKYPDKEFMFLIVSNDKNGIDVDKWDYLARDAFYLGQNKTFNYRQLIAHAKALKVNGTWNICYPIKLKEHIQQIYHLRRWNFTHAYQHRVVLNISSMFEDAVKEAKLKQDKAVKDAKSQITDMSTDAIYYDLHGSSDLIKRIEERKLYVTLGGIPKNKLFPDANSKKSDDEIKRSFLKKFRDVKDMPTYKELRVRQHYYKYGETAKRYFQKIYFYAKDNPNDARALPAAEIDAMFSAAFAVPTIFFYSTKDGKFDELKEKIKNCVYEQN